MAAWNRKRNVWRRDPAHERVGRQVSLVRIGVSTAGLLSAYLATPFLPLRNLLPEPVDLFDHISNVGIAPAAAAAAGILYAGTHGQRPAGGGLIWELSAAHVARFKRYCLPIAMGAVALGNAFVESQYGTALQLLSQSPALLDVAYPTVATGLAGLTMWRNRTGPHVPSPGSHASPTTGPSHITS